jgi:hypothetical protein
MSKLTQEQRDALTFASGYMLGQDFKATYRVLASILKDHQDPGEPIRIPCTNPKGCTRKVSIPGEEGVLCPECGFSVVPEQS